jgi:hypothetical protein
MGDVQVDDNEDNNAAELLARLNSQFGDMDLRHLLAADNTNTTTEDAESDESSSLVEPSPEELQAWQAAQFKKGKEKCEEQKKDALSPLRRRRQEKKNTNGSNEDFEVLYSDPDLNGQESVFFPSSSSKDDGVEFVGPNPLLAQLAAGDPEVLGGQWLRLYSSIAGDGLSFHHLLDALKGYGGPTVMIVGTVASAKHSLTTTGTANKPRSSTAGTLGVYTATPWIASTQFFGSDDCFLFSFSNNDEDVRILRPTETVNKNEKRNYMYCHPSSLNTIHRRSATTATDGAVHGIGVGGTPSQPRLHLTETLEECRALGFCRLFEPGQLLPESSGADSLYYFDVDALEVWGVGGQDWIQEALESRQQERERVQSILLKARTVDKKQFVDDFRSGILGDAGKGLFGHVEHVAERADECDVKSTA